jgi:small nuclear ribonucleoprotein (snRNP)-like protein
MPFFIAPTPAGAPMPSDTFTWKTGDIDAVLVQTKSNWTFVGTLTASDKTVYTLTDPEMQVGDGG